MSYLLEVFSQKYDDKIILGVFNLKLNIQSLKAFIDKQNFRRLIQNNTTCKVIGLSINLLLRKVLFKKIIGTIILVHGAILSKWSWVLNLEQLCQLRLEIIVPAYFWNNRTKVTWEKSHQLQLGAILPVTLADNRTSFTWEHARAGWWLQAKTAEKLTKLL